MSFVADLADKVSRLLEHLAVPHTRQRVAQQCRAIVESSYDWDHIVDQLEQVYQEVIHRSDGSAVE